MVWLQKLRRASTRSSRSVGANQSSHRSSTKRPNSAQGISKPRSFDNGTISIPNQSAYSSYTGFDDHLCTQVYFYENRSPIHILFSWLFPISILVRFCFFRFINWWELFLLIGLQIRPDERFTLAVDGSRSSRCRRSSSNGWDAIRRRGDWNASASLCRCSGLSRLRQNANRVTYSGFQVRE